MYFLLWLKAKFGNNAARENAINQIADQYGEKTLGVCKSVLKSMSRRMSRRLCMSDEVVVVRVLLEWESMLPASKDHLERKRRLLLHALCDSIERVDDDLLRKAAAFSQESGSLIVYVDGRRSEVKSERFDWSELHVLANHELARRSQFRIAAT